MNFDALLKNVISARETQEDLLKEVESALLKPTGLAISDLSSIIEPMLKPGIDLAEIFFQQKWREHWVLEESSVKDSQFTFDSGAGIRALSGETSGFAYSNQLDLALLQKTGALAAHIAQAGKTYQMQSPTHLACPSFYPAVDPQRNISASTKIDLLMQADRLARQLDASIVKVDVSLSITYERVLIFASDGTLSADVRPMVQASVTVMASRGKLREQGHAGGGARVELTEFIRHGGFEDYVRKAVSQALLNLTAKEAPAGQLPVILGPGWPAVLLHEAVGHGLEADFNRKGSSVYSHKKGEMIANDAVNIVDDASLSYRRGSLTIDDEGVPGQCTPLIENGRLVNYMQDKLNARLMNQSLTGNGRRQSYAHLPIPRMTNTYMLPGSFTQEEMIQSVKRGIFAVNFSGGQVDITSGQFVFVANEAYLIEDGKIQEPLKNVTLIGDGQEIMHGVSMIGNDLQFDSGIGVCGKQGQSVAVGVGQPSLKINQMTIGGTRL